ncbi:MAG: HNH endonuclease [candidate division KSB1 bacterium]|nr:HNH endonuclease [candidate division KSB1 bacterium]MDZ7304455.1 HNH endonuclease [candidate division KSB1 bacterium]MDZ7310948.1 HNH endonuclease [candidate division KSB1 bacterium]
MNPHYPMVAERAGHRCEYCHAPEAIFNVPFEVEHVIPLTKGGLDEETNWALACRSCNLNKSNHIDGLDAQTQQRVRLFHPRRDDWTDHFAVEQKAPFKLHGLISIANATIALLMMNSPLQLAARKQWIELGLFS